MRLSVLCTKIMSMFYHNLKGIDEKEFFNYTALISFFPRIFYNCVLTCSTNCEDRTRFQKKKKVFSMEQVLVPL